MTLTRVGNGELNRYPGAPMSSTASSPARNGTGGSQTPSSRAMAGRMSRLVS